MGGGVIITDDDIPAFILILVALLPKMEALEARVGQSFVYGKHGGIYSLDFLGKVGYFVTESFPFISKRF